MDEEDYWVALSHIPTTDDIVARRGKSEDFREISSGQAHLQRLFFQLHGGDEAGRFYSEHRTIDRIQDILSCIANK